MSCLVKKSRTRKIESALLTAAPGTWAEIDGARANLGKRLKNTESTKDNDGTQEECGRKNKRKEPPGRDKGNPDGSEKAN